MEDQTQTSSRLEKISGVVVRPLETKNLAAADQIFRLAFGTFLGMPDPMQFGRDSDYIRSRWRANPESVLGAELNGELVATNFVANWGSFGLFGPLSVRPDLWGRGIAQRLLEPTMAMFDLWGTKHRGLFTFQGSPKHVALYRKYGFSPRDPIVIVSKVVDPATKASGWSKLSVKTSRDKETILGACMEVTDEIYEGLNVEREIRAVIDQRLGDVVLLDGGTRLEGFAVCHCGAGSEAGTGNCYIKFAAVRPGPKVPRELGNLLDACTALAAERCASKLGAGVNTARAEAHRLLLESGFTFERGGIAMETGSASSGYNHAGVFVLDDWR